MGSRSVLTFALGNHTHGRGTASRPDLCTLVLLVSRDAEPSQEKV